MSFHPVTCQRCFKVIDFKDGEFVDSSTGYQVYCTDCIEAVLVDAEERDCLDSDPEFGKWLDFIEKEGKDDQDSDLSRSE